MKLSSVSHRCKKQTWRPPQLSCTECSDRGTLSDSLSSCSFLHFSGDHQAQDSLQCKSLHAWTLPHFHQLGLGSKHGMPYLRTIFFNPWHKSRSKDSPPLEFLSPKSLASQKLYSFTHRGSNHVLPESFGYVAKSFHRICSTSCSWLFLTSLRSQKETQFVGNSLCRNPSQRQNVCSLRKHSASLNVLCSVTEDLASLFLEELWT